MLNDKNKFKYITMIYLVWCLSCRSQVETSSLILLFTHFQLVFVLLLQTACQWVHGHWVQLDLITIIPDDDGGDGNGGDNGDGGGATAATTLMKDFSNRNVLSFVKDVDQWQLLDINGQIVPQKRSSNGKWSFAKLSRSHTMRVVGGDQIWLKNEVIS